MSRSQRKMQATAPDLVESTFSLMREKRMTYAEARAELGRRGATARESKRRKRQAHAVIMERMGLA
jgi:hypothetical protein